MIEDMIYKYWLVQLGNLFYVQGLLRKSPGDLNIISYEFADNEDVAFPILIEEIAQGIADKIGGVIVRREKNFKDMSTLERIHETYTHSEKEWIKEQEEQFF